MIRALFKPMQHWVWSDTTRRANILLRFAEVEEDSRRDLVRAAELTRDPRLRRLYFRHARDERRHAETFNTRAVELLREAAGERATQWQADWLSPGERGLDDVKVDGSDGPLLAFLTLSEGTATRLFADYREAVKSDDATRAIFDRIMRDEEYHMNYTRRELARVSPERQHQLLWKARLSRVWKAYLRFAVGLAGVIGGLVLTLQYFILLPIFAWQAKRAMRREPEGWAMIGPQPNAGLDRQF